MSRTTGRRYPVTMVCAVWRAARATVYVQRSGATRLATVARSCPESDDREVGRHLGTPLAPRKRGPRTPLDDATV